MACGCLVRFSLVRHHLPAKVCLQLTLLTELYAPHPNLQSPTSNLPAAPATPAPPAGAPAIYRQSPAPAATSYPATRALSARISCSVAPCARCPLPGTAPAAAHRPASLSPHSPASPPTSLAAGTASC